MPLLTGDYHKFVIPEMSIETWVEAFRLLELLALAPWGFSPRPGLVRRTSRHLG